MVHHLLLTVIEVKLVVVAVIIQVPADTIERVAVVVVIRVVASLMVDSSHINSACTEAQLVTFIGKPDLTLVATSTLPQVASTNRIQVVESDQDLGVSFEVDIITARAYHHPLLGLVASSPSLVVGTDLRHQVVATLGHLVGIPSAAGCFTGNLLASECIRAAPACQEGGCLGDLGNEQGPNAKSECYPVLLRCKIRIQDYNIINKVLMPPKIDLCRGGRK